MGRSRCTFNCSASKFRCFERQSRPRSLSCGLFTHFSYRRSILGSVERQLTRSTTHNHFFAAGAALLQESLEFASVPALGSLHVHTINSNHPETLPPSHVLADLSA